MRKIFLITMVLLIITLSIGVFATSVTAGSKKKITPTPTEILVTPTEIITAITETPPPSATGGGALTSIQTFVATQAGVVNASVAGGQAVGQAPAGGGQAAAAAQQGQQAAQAVTQQSQQAQVLGAAGMAPTGSFAQTLMNIYTIFGMLLVTAGFTSYAKEKKIL